MQQTDSRKIAVAGVLVTAVLAACLALPAVDQLATIAGTWVVAVFTVALALSGSTVGPAMGVVLLGAPALSVIVLGLLALRFVPPRSVVVDRPFEHANSG